MVSFLGIHVFVVIEILLKQLTNARNQKLAQHSWAFQEINLRICTAPDPSFDQYYFSEKGLRLLCIFKNFSFATKPNSETTHNTIPPERFPILLCTCKKIETFFKHYCFYILRYCFCFKRHFLDFTVSADRFIDPSCFAAFSQIFECWINLLRELMMSLNYNSAVLGI